MGKEIKGFTPSAIQRMMLYPWPGNIRELKNTLERAVVLTMHDVIDVPDLIPLASVEEAALPAATAPSLSVTYEDAKQDFEKSYLEHLLRQTQGNVTNAAKTADRYRGDLYRLMKKYGLKSDDFK